MEPSKQELLAQIAGLKTRLAEAEDTLEALQHGAVDAFVVSSPTGEKIFTLQSADYSYRHLIENMNEGAATLTAAGDILYANRRLAAILGLPLEQVIGTALGQYIAKGDQQLLQALFVQAENGVSQGEISLRSRAGLVPAHLSLSSLQLEDAPGALSLVVTDLTQQKRQEALLADGKLSQEILLQAKQPIAVCDRSGRIIRASRGLQQLCGHNPLLQPFATALPLILAGDQTFSLGPLFQGETLHNVEAALPTTDGRQVHVLLNAGPLLAENREVTGFVAAFTDITERLREQEEKAKLEARLLQAQKMEAIGVLAGGIAHDFNNILWAMLGFTEMTLMSMPENSQDRFNLEQVMQAGHRAKELVEQILAFSRKSVKEIQPLGLALIVREALRLLRATLPTTIDIETEVKSSEVMVLADGTQIHQVLMNLATNAAQAMQETGGLLQVGLETVMLHEADAPGEPPLPPGPYAALTVTDTGPGMDPAVMSRIFEPFFTTKGVGEGSGMGLSVAQGIVKAHGGEITARSLPGQGSTFTVYLPVLAAKPTSAPKIGAPLPTGQGRILCVDDEPALVNLLRLELEKLGYDVTASNSSEEALQLFQADPGQFDLVITDQTMPHLTGLQLAREMLRLRPDLPIIICTGYSDKVTDITTKEAGLRRLLMKPLDLRQLAQAVREVLAADS